MHVRTATRADLPAIIDVTAHAWTHSEAHASLWPHRALYPTDYAATQRAKHRQRFAARGTTPIVCVADDTDSALGPPGTILGVAYYAAKPDGPAYDARTAPRSTLALAAPTAPERARNAGALAALERALLRAEEAYRGAVLPDRAAAAPDVDRAVRAGLDGHAQLAALPGRLHLELLAVDPRAARRGVGRALTAWGVDWARARGAPVTLMSSVDAHRLYVSAGFRVVGWLKCAVEGEWRGGAVMLFDPEGVWSEGVQEGTTYCGRPVMARLKGVPAAGVA